MTTTQWRGALIVLLTWLMTACSSTPQPVAWYNLDVQAQNQVNGGAPLKVRVVLLTSDAEFMSADFYSLQNPSANALGNAQLNTQQFFLTSTQPHKTLGLRVCPRRASSASWRNIRRWMARSGDCRCRFPKANHPHSGRSGSVTMVS